MKVSINIIALLKKLLMKIATRAAFWDALAKIWETNKAVVALDADLSGSTKTSVFKKSFPDRFFNIWIAEQDLVWTAAWLAVAWKIPVCASFAMFASWRAWEQIRNTVCYSDLHVIVVWTHAWILTWEDWASHQALEDIAILRSIPNIRIIQPADSIETHKALEYLIENPWPAYLRLTRAWVYSVNPDNYEFKIWKNKILADFWDDATIFASWAVTWNSLMVSERLKDKWIKVKVVNISSIKPLDENNIKQMCLSCKQAFTIEDHSTTGWIWSAVAEVIADNWISCPLIRLWMHDFWESWTTDDLYKKYKLDVDWIEESILENMKKK